MRCARLAIVVGLVGLGRLVGACGSTSESVPAPATEGGAVDPGTADAAADAAAEGAPGFPDTNGPGIYGALPSGYCCTKDAECWGRKCRDTGSGQKMCADFCTDDIQCDVPKTPFTCKLAAGDTAKRCTPPAGFACIPQGDFVRGKNAFGDCCAFAAGQQGGAECASHVCGSFGDGPYICSAHCAVQTDCPDGYKCETQGAGDTYVPTCWPLAVYSGGTYTCK